MQLQAGLYQNKIPLTGLSTVSCIFASVYEHNTSYSAASSTDGPKGRMSRRWTHNEQLFVYPCGVIASRATFFGSEGVSGVKVDEAEYLLILECRLTYR
jgi:hypothetical protein